MPAATDSGAITEVAIVAGSEWDLLDPSTAERIEITRVTPLHVQYIRVTGGDRSRVLSKPIQQFRREYTPTAKTLRALSKRMRAEAGRQIRAHAEPVSPAATPGPTAVPVTEPEQVPASEPAPNAETDAGAAPSLDEQIVTAWKAGASFAALRDQFRIGPARLKQMLIPHGYVGRDDKAGRAALMEQRRQALLTEPAPASNGRQPTSPLPEGLDAEVVTITPQMAAAWLEKGGTNRPIDQKWVDIYAGRMTRGEWRLTGEAIKLNTRGEVKDGQHRLWAVIESGVSIRTLVVINIEDEAFDVMDSGHARTIADVLAIHQVTNSTRVAPAARLEIIWREHATPMLAGRRPVTSPQVLEFLDANPDFETAVTIGERISRSGLPGGTAVWSCVAFRLMHVNARDAEAFIHALIEGANLQSGNPILALRNRLLGARSRLTTAEVAALAIKSWNSWRHQERVNVLVWRRAGPTPENFPTPR